IFSLMFHPSDPVENSLAIAVISLPLITTVTGLAEERNCSRVIGSDAFDLAICRSFWLAWETRGRPASYHAGRPWVVVSRASPSVPRLLPALPLAELAQDAAAGEGAEEDCSEQDARRRRDRAARTGRTAGRAAGGLPAARGAATGWAAGTGAAAGVHRRERGRRDVW